MVKREFSLTSLERSDTGILQILSQKISENYTLLWKGTDSWVPSLRTHAQLGDIFFLLYTTPLKLKGRAGGRGQLERGGGVEEGKRR